MATEYGFVRDTLEKVYRLADILEYINSEPLSKERIEKHPMVLWKIRQQ